MRIRMTMRRVDWVVKLLIENGYREAVTPWLPLINKAPSRPRTGPSKFDFALPAAGWRKVAQINSSKVTGPKGGYSNDAARYQIELDAQIWRELAGLETHPGVQGQAVPASELRELTPIIPAWIDSHGNRSIYPVKGWNFRVLRPEIEGPVPGVGRVALWHPYQARFIAASTVVDACLIQPALHDAFA